MISLTVLGSTGSVGTNTLKVVEQHLNEYKVFALSANRNVNLMFEQCKKFIPEFAVMVEPKAAEELKSLLRSAAISTKVLTSVDGLCEIANHSSTDYVMAAIVGAAGLLPTLSAAAAGKRVLIANKEALVMAGSLFMQTAKQNNAKLIPIDSEHNAILQCLPINSDNQNLTKMGVKKITLTASGGPFLHKSFDELGLVTPEQACAHPNWSMGQKISVDSATMMNKGFELIEAHWLFGANRNQLDVLIHPQSIVHSLVEYVDGSVMAQLGQPDMRTPIAVGLAWPERIETDTPVLNLAEISQLTFIKPKPLQFPCLQFAYDALDAKGSALVALNASNEVAVDAFLNKQLEYVQIPMIIESVLTKIDSCDAETLNEVLLIDQQARELASEFVSQTTL